MSKIHCVSLTFFLFIYVFGFSFVTSIKRDLFIFLTYPLEGRGGAGTNLS